MTLFTKASNVLWAISMMAYWIVRYGLSGAVDHSNEEIIRLRREIWKARTKPDEN